MEEPGSKASNMNMSRSGMVDERDVLDDPVLHIGKHCEPSQLRDATKSVNREYVHFLEG